MARNDIVKVDGSIDYDYLGKSIDGLSSQMADNTKNLKSNFVNVLYPPTGLSPCIADANYQKEDGTWWKDSGFTITSTDNTPLLQAIIDWVCSNGYPIIKVPNGNYYFSDTVKTPQAFEQPIIIGDNPSTTRFKYISSISQGILIFKGGSGAPANSYIKNIGFDGLDTTYALEFQGCRGVKAINCQFGKNLTGVLFHNKDTGEFTEYDVVEDCDFTQDCHKSIEYKSDNEVNSFHGSGLKDCTINQSSTETNPKIVIGSNCLPYNAPMSFQCWTRTTTPIIQNNGDARANFHGDITIEPLFSSGNTNLMDISTNKAIYVVGGILCNNQLLNTSSCFFCDRIQLNSDGTLNAMAKPYNRNKELTTGSNALIAVTDCETLLINIRIFANYYEYNYTLLAFKDVNDDNGAVTILATNRAFNQAGYGDSSFSFSNGILYVTNPNFPASGVATQFTVTQIGARVQYFMN